LQTETEQHLKTKQNQTKTIIKPPNPLTGERAPKKDFNFSFLPKDFEKLFLDWLDYKKSKGQAYKNQHSLELCFANLLEISGAGGARTAQLVVNQAIANNWAGLYPLKTDNQTNYGKSNTIRDAGCIHPGLRENLDAKVYGKGDL
jgi:hypothetical protein